MNRFSLALWGLLISGVVLSTGTAAFNTDASIRNLILGSCVAFVCAACAMAFWREPSPLVALGLGVGVALLDFPLTAILAGREDQRERYDLILFGGIAAAIVGIIYGRLPPHPVKESTEWAQRELYTGSLVFMVVMHVLVDGLLGPVQLGDNFRARRMRAVSDVTHLAETLSKLRTDTGNHSPTCLDVNHLNVAHSPAGCGALPDCAARPKDDPLVPCWGGPYLPRVSTDPWGGDYRAAVNLKTSEITVTSKGGDRVPNTEDDVLARQP